MAFCERGVHSCVLWLMIPGATHVAACGCGCGPAARCYSAEDSSSAEDVEEAGSGEEARLPTGEGSREGARWWAGRGRRAARGGLRRGGAEPREAPEGARRCRRAEGLREPAEAEETATGGEVGTGVTGRGEAGAGGGEGSRSGGGVGVRAGDRWGDLAGEEAAGEERGGGEGGGGVA